MCESESPAGAASVTGSAAASTAGLGSGSTASGASTAGAGSGTASDSGLALAFSGAIEEGGGVAEVVTLDSREVICELREA